MEILCITATKNRHTHLEKLVRCFLEQDYEGQHTLLIYNNAVEKQTLDKIELPSNKKIILINNNTDLTTKNPYTVLGTIYNDIIHHIDWEIMLKNINPTVINHMDDDDFYLPNHLSQGVKGYLKGGKKGYKPAKSFYKDLNGTQLASNVLEPSIFVEWKHIKSYGYLATNADSHHKWLKALVDNDQLFVDQEGTPTFIYDWSGQIPTWKTSGDPNNPNNFNNYTNFSKDCGDQIITPISKENYYSLLKQ